MRLALALAILLFSGNALAADEQLPEGTVLVVQMYPHKGKNTTFYEIIQPRGKGTTTATGTDCPGVCRDACLDGESEQASLAVPDEVASQYTMDLKSVGKLTSLNYCGEITLERIYRLRDFGYQIDWDRIKTKQKCCIKK